MAPGSTAWWHFARRCSNPPTRFVTTVSEKLFTYALGRGLEHYDAPAVRTVVRDAARDDYRFSSLILGIVKSLPFQMSRKTANATCKCESAFAFELIGAQHPMFITKMALPRRTFLKASAPHWRCRCWTPWFRLSPP